MAVPTLLLSRRLLLGGFKVPFAGLCCTWSEPQAPWFLVHTRNAFLSTIYLIYCRETFFPDTKGWTRRQLAGSPPVSPPGVQERPLGKQRPPTTVRPQAKADSEDGRLGWAVGVIKPWLLQVRENKPLFASATINWVFCHIRLSTSQLARWAGGAARRLLRRGRSGTGDRRQWRGLWRLSPFRSSVLVCLLRSVFRTVRLSKHESPHRLLLA